MSWFRPITAGDPNAAQAYWGSPFNDALAGMTGFIQGREQAAAARAAAEQQRLENERAAAELDVKRRTIADRERRTDIDLWEKENKAIGDREEKERLAAALAEHARRGSITAQNAVDGDASAMYELRSLGLPADQLDSILRSPEPIRGETIAFIAELLAAKEQDKNLTPTDEREATVLQQAYAEMAGRRDRGEPWAVSGAEWIALKDRLRSALITERERAEQAGKPAPADAAAQTLRQRHIEELGEILFRARSDPRGLEAQAGSQLTAGAAFGMTYEDAPVGSPAAMMGRAMQPTDARGDPIPGAAPPAAMEDLSAEWNLSDARSYLANMSDADRRFAAEVFFPQLTPEVHEQVFGRFRPTDALPPLP